MIGVVELFKPRTDQYHCRKCGNEFIFIDIYNKPCNVKEINMTNIKFVICKNCRERREVLWDNQGNPYPMYHPDILHLCNPHAP